NQEVAGPLPNAGGYNPYIITVGAGQEGVWEIDFISPTVGRGFTNGMPDDILASSNWTQNDNTSYIAAFDVSVRNTANTGFINGRAFMNVFGGCLGDYSALFNAKFKILTKDGYQYDVNNNGQAG